MKAKEYEQKEAVRLRGDGWLIPEIAKHLNVSRGSVHLWAGHIKVVTPYAEDHLKKIRLKAVPAAQRYHRERRKVAREAGRIKAGEGSVLHGWGCMLYWAEGAKSCNRLCLVNTDKMMIKLFMDFLVGELSVEKSKVVVSVRFHGKEYRPENPETADVANFWASFLGVDKDSLSVHKITDQRCLGGPKKFSSRNSHPYGMCCLKVNDVTKVQHIYGALEHYAGVILRPKDVEEV